MTKTQHGIKYATHIITNHFGNLVAKVCECLLRKGPLSVPKIMQFTELSHTQVKNGLLVLIQHNCVQAYRYGDDDKPTAYFIALFDNILHRVRFSKFLTVLSSQQFDKLCVDIVQGLLEHGRLTVKQIVDRANSSQKEGNSISLDAVQESLRKLAIERYIEHCPAAEPVLEPPTEEETRAKKRGAKSSKIESETIEQRVSAAALPMDAKRFSVDLDTGAEDQDKSPEKHAGDKRKLDALEPNIDREAEQDEVVLWRANFEEFIRRLRDKACIENVRARLDDGAAIVLGAMLDASRTEEKKVRTASSVELSTNSIYEEAIKNEKGRNMTFDHIQAALDQLTSHPPFVREVGGSYSIDFRHIIEVCQSDEVESIVLKRYGRDAYRIFRLLSKAGHFLETDKISDTVFVEKKETTKILYRMWQDEYLLMEKLVAGTATFLLWKVNKHTLWEHVLDEMFHASLNLSIRVAHELEQGKEILNVPPEKREGLLKQKHESLRKMRFLMESSLLKLDDAIMLFNDFRSRSDGCNTS